MRKCFVLLACSPRSKFTVKFDVLFVFSFFSCLAPCLNSCGLFLKSCFSRANNMFFRSILQHYHAIRRVLFNLLAVRLLVTLYCPCECIPMISICLLSLCSVLHSNFYKMFSHPRMYSISAQYAFAWLFYLAPLVWMVFMMVLSLTFLILKNLHFIYFKLPYASVVFILQPEIQSAIKKQLERTMWNNEFLQSHEFVQSHEFLRSHEFL